MISLSRCRELEPGDSVGTTSSLLLHVSLEFLDTHDSRNGVSTVVDPVTAPPMPDAPTQDPTPDLLDEPYPDLISQLNDR